MGRLAGGVRRCVRLLRRIVSKLNRVFLARIALKLFRRPETAICYALNAMPPSPERVISNYCQGMVLLGKNLQGDMLWHTFPERAIITPETAHVPKRLQRSIRRCNLTVRLDSDFVAAVRACHREAWAWINEATIDIYARLFSMGFARSIEAYRGEQLVGAMWGLEVGRTFGAMSMFHSVNCAGSVLFGTLVEKLMEGEWDMVDCGEPHSHFTRFGAQDVPREEFIERVVRGLPRASAPCSPSSSPPTAAASSRQPA